MVPVPQPGIARALNLREELFPARASTQREVKRGGGRRDKKATRNKRKRNRKNKTAWEKI